MGDRWQVMRDPDILPNWDPGAGEGSSVQKMVFDGSERFMCWAARSCEQAGFPHDLDNCHRDHHCQTLGLDILEGLCSDHYSKIFGFKEVRYYSG